MACELDYEGNREIFDLRLDVDIRCKWRALSTSNPPLPRMWPYVTFLGRLWRPAFLCFFSHPFSVGQYRYRGPVLISRFL